VSPFEVDPSTDVAICEDVEEGAGSDRSRRDWCYWYAAYQRGDTSICDNIEWDEMREKCVAGGNPDSYYIISYPASP